MHNNNTRLLKFSKNNNKSTRSGQYQSCITPPGGGAGRLGALLRVLRVTKTISTTTRSTTVEGLPVATLRMALMLLIAVVIAVAMKIVGVLLITTLLIIPAEIGRAHV